MTGGPSPVTVEVVSDVVCPWCFIGKRRLERALESFPRPVAVRWRAFELNPGLPRQGLDRRPFHLAKFGGEANLKAAYDRVADAGREEGIVFAQDKIRRQPNTLDAHRLLTWSGARGKQSVLAENLFQAFFCEGLDVGDRAVLAGQAGRSGLDAGEATRFLESDEGAAEAREEQDRYRKMGVRAVPTFIFSGGTLLTGAEPPDVILAALEREAGARQ